MDIKKLKEAAEKATPGPWVAKDAPGAGLEIYADVPAQLGMASREWPAFSTANADVKSNLVAYETWVQFPVEKLRNVQARNAVFIATANPAAVLELIASHERLAKALKLVQLEVMGTHPHDTKSFLPEAVMTTVDAALAAAEAA